MPFTDHNQATFYLPSGGAKKLKKESFFTVLFTYFAGAFPTKSYKKLSVYAVRNTPNQAQLRKAALSEEIFNSNYLFEC